MGSPAQPSRLPGPAAAAGPSQGPGRRAAGLLERPTPRINRSGSLLQRPRVERSCATYLSHGAAPASVRASYSPTRRRRHQIPPLPPSQQPCSAAGRLQRQRRLLRCRRLQQPSLTAGARGKWRQRETAQQALLRQQMPRQSPSRAGSTSASGFTTELDGRTAEGCGRVLAHPGLQPLLKAPWACWRSCASARRNLPHHHLQTSACARWQSWRAFQSTSACRLWSRTSSAAKAARRLLQLPGG